MQHKPTVGPNFATALDLIERAVLCVLFSVFAWTILHSVIEERNFLSLLLLVSESAVVFFVLIRRPTGDISIRPVDWFVALAGTALPLLAQPFEGAPLAPPILCGLIMIFGILLQIAAKFTLRRSFGVIAANRGVKIDGPYRFVRHPMYAGYVLTQIGFLLANPLLWNLAIYAVGFGFQLCRILAEENVLRRDPAYQDFASSVRYRLLPGVF